MATRRRRRFPGNARRAIAARSLLLARSDAAGWNFRVAGLRAYVENLGSVGVGRNLYDVAFDPTRAGRIAVAGWGPGVVVSDDGGKTWVARNAGLPRPEVWSVAFDPDHSGRLYCGVHEEALYVSDDAGVNWRKDGLEGSIVHRMTFVPERRAR